MDIYLKLIDVIVPVFALVGIGFYLGRKNPNYNTEFITNFAAKFGSPGIAFYAITSTGISFNLFICSTDTRSSTWCIVLPTKPNSTTGQ